MEEDSENNRPTWQKSTSEILDEFQVDEGEGLTREEATQRKQELGPNKLRETKLDNPKNLSPEQKERFAKSPIFARVSPKTNSI